MLATQRETKTRSPRLYRGASSARYILEAIMPPACTNMLYNAAETVRERTAFELREFQATWIGWAVGVSMNERQRGDGEDAAHLKDN
jgi:hypothetical protein